MHCHTLTLIAKWKLEGSKTDLKKEVGSHMQGQTGYAIRTVVGLEDPESLSTVVAFSEDGDPSSRADGGQAGEKQLAGQVKRGK